MAYPIDQSYRDNVRSLFPQYGLATDHAVLTLLDNLHDYTFEAIVKAYDFYTLGALRRFSEELDRHSGLVDIFVRYFEETFEIESIDEQHSITIKHAINALELHQTAPFEQCIFDLLVSVQVVEKPVTKGFCNYLKPPKRDKAVDSSEQKEKNLNTKKPTPETAANSKIADALTQAMRRHLNANSVPPEIWIAVAQICDELEKADDLEITLRNCFLALICWYLGEDNTAKVNAKISDSHGEEPYGVTGAYEISLRAIELEEMQLADPTIVLYPLCSYRNPLENSNIRIATDSPNLIARIAVATLFFKKYYEAVKPVGLSSYKSDFANWLLHRLWRSKDYHQGKDCKKDKYAPEQDVENNVYECISTSKINDHAGQDIVYTELLGVSDENTNIFNTKNAYEYFKGTASFTTEYNSAESWAGCIARHGAFATNTNEIERIGCTMFVRHVWEHLLKNSCPHIHNAGVVAAASKLAIACLEDDGKVTQRKRLISKETIGRAFWCKWTPDPATLANWINHFESSLNGKQIHKHAMTDQIYTVGQLVQYVTGQETDINTMQLVQMARSIYFGDLTRHDQRHLRETGSDLFDETLWNTPWNTLSSDSHLALERPEGLPHHWLYGKTFFIEVEKAIQQVAKATQIQTHDGLIQKSARWVRHLLCIPWCDERKINGQPYQLLDRPSVPDMFKAIQAVFIVAQHAKSFAKSYEVSSALAPIYAGKSQTFQSAYFQRPASTT